MGKRGSSEGSGDDATKPSGTGTVQSAQPAAPPIAPAVGDTIDRKFKLLSLLGTGAMGTVFKAEQIQIERLVAIKFLHQHLASDEGSMARFRREAQLASRLRNPHTVLIFEYGIWQNIPYLVMELAEGTSLRELLQSGATLSPDDTKTLLVQVGAALSEAHGLGIVHRDLKPENISVKQDPGRRISFKVLDFGLAKSETLAPSSPAGATRYGMFFGTPAYASPEQAVAKPVGPASDIYSLGVVAYEALVGTPPFHGGTDLELLMKQVKEPHPPLSAAKIPDLHPGVAALIDRCLEKDPERRFKDATALLDALAKAEPPPLPHPQPIPQFEVHHAIVGACVLALAVLGIWALIPNRDESTVAKLENTPAAELTVVAEPIRTAAQAPTASAPLPTYAAPVPTASAIEPTTAPLWTLNPAGTLPPLPTYQYLLPTPHPETRITPQAQVIRELDRGRDQFSAGRYSDSIRTMQGVVQADPSQVEAWVTMALSYEHLKYCREAQPALQQAIALDSRQAILYFYLSRVQAQCRQTSDALAALKVALQLDPTLRTRAANDALFAAISRRSEFRTLVGAPARAGSTVDAVIGKLQRSISNLWR